MVYKFGLASRQAGFTMIELVVTLSLLSIMMGLGYPSLAELRRSFVRNSAKQQLDFDIHRAKSEAVKVGARTVMTVSGGGSVYSLGYDYPPYNSPAAADSGQSIFVRNLPRSFSISLSQALIFDSRGYVVDGNGILSNVNTTLSDNGTAFLGATVFPTGYIQYNY